jgi:hypothetical protein
MKKDSEEKRESESLINLPIQEKKLINLLEQIKDMGGQVSTSKSETHFKNDPQNSFSLRLNDTISVSEDGDNLKVTWTKNESLPSMKTSRVTEVVVIVSEHVEKIMMKFNFNHRNGPEPYTYHDTPRLNWWMVLTMLNSAIEESLSKN